MSKFSIRIGTTIRHDIERVYDDITKRASEIFRDRNGERTLDAADWLATERQLLWKPEVQMVERQDLFILRARLNNIDPASVTILVTPQHLVVQSIETAPYPHVFRAIHFPRSVNPVQVQATYANGRLIVIVPKIPVREVVEPAQGLTAFTAAR